jgi:hypothetical protein
LKTKETGNEWQLMSGAAFLCRRGEIDLAMWYFAGGKKLTNYWDTSIYKDRMALSNIAIRME